MYLNSLSPFNGPTGSIGSVVIREKVCHNGMGFVSSEAHPASRYLSINFVFAIK